MQRRDEREQWERKQSRDNEQRRDGGAAVEAEQRQRRRADVETEAKRQKQRQRLKPAEFRAMSVEMGEPELGVEARSFIGSAQQQPSARGDTQRKAHIYRLKRRSLARPTVA